MKGKMIHIRGKDLYIEEHGERENPAVLYLHGGPGESCYDFSYHQADRLKDSLRVITLDQRGVCRSEGLLIGEKLRLMDLIEDCEAIREKLFIDKWSVIGHSFGGYLAVLYACLYPTSIEKIILECPTFDFELTAKSLLRKTAWLFEKYEEKELATLCQLACKSHVSPRELVETYIDLSCELGDKRAEIYVHNNLVTTDYSLYSSSEWEEFDKKSDEHFLQLREEGAIFSSLLPRLKEVKQRVLLIIGKYDTVTCEVQKQSFLQYVKRAELVEFEHSAHSPHYEEASRFSHIIKKFFT
ncbi:alpha/beta fold hydrolase [Priestia taiwanensis]|uniref:Proline iminopeptidase n=1 Tax=Priestia taiwanensis TaxID=1347902 RepID=A0A917EM64_9BACI|nr:alpha/beta hydrolase [Priestia taiwanensis]MBM7362236.1 proline iminopeptidase [Priestia taiwanensis]GGE60533.1 proline iminopeptidase [Priestia taiwanensis]